MIRRSTTTCRRNSAMSMTRVSSFVFTEVRGRTPTLCGVVCSERCPAHPNVTTTPFADVVGSQTASWTMGARMFTLFGLLALIVAAIGLYSVIAYAVEQRTH